MSADCANASRFTRALTLARSTPNESSPGAPTMRPSSSASSMSAMSSAVAIRVLLGTQSVITADPPSPSESTTVTSAPSCAATSAAS